MVTQTEEIKFSKLQLSHEILDILFKNEIEKYNESENTLLIRALNLSGANRLDPTEVKTYIVAGNLQMYRILGYPGGHKVIKVSEQLSLRNEFISLQAEKDILENGKRKLEHYLRSLLLVCNNVTDVWELIPEKLRDKLVSLISSFEDTTFSEDEIKEHKEQLKPYENWVKEKFLEDFICDPSL